MALPAYANNIPENVSQWLDGISTKTSQSNAAFSIGATADKGASFGSTFKLNQAVKIVGDIKIAPEHVNKKGDIYIVASYNGTWFMKNASGWVPWNLSIAGLEKYKAVEKLPAIQSPVVQDGITGLLGNFSVYLGYGVEDDLNYSKTPFNFTVKPVTANQPIVKDPTFRALNDTAAGVFNFTKLDGNGVALVAQNTPWSPVGSEAENSQWSCVKDNKTGLVWEVKTSLNNMTPYKWGGLTAIGENATSPFGIYDPEWNSLVDATNAGSGLCGMTEWRVPTKNELSSITDKSVVGGLAIKTHYFPNTFDGFYWTSSPYAFDESKAWIVGFGSGLNISEVGAGIGDGHDQPASRVNQYQVRLVAN